MDYLSLFFAINPRVTKIPDIPDSTVPIDHKTTLWFIVADKAIAEPLPSNMINARIDPFCNFL